MHRIKEILASSVYFTVKSPLQWNIACILRNILHVVSEILYVLICVPTLPEEDTFYACEVILSSSHKRSRLWKEPTQMTKNRGGWSETADSVGRNSLLPLHMLTTVPRVRTRFKEQTRFHHCRKTRSTRTCVRTSSGHCCRTAYMIHRTDAAYCWVGYVAHCVVCVCLCVSVSVPVTAMSWAKTDELIEMLQTCMGQKNHVLDGAAIAAYWHHLANTNERWYVRGHDAALPVCQITQPLVTCSQWNVSIKFD